MSTKEAIEQVSKGRGADASPGDHRGRRPARDVAYGEDAGSDVLLVLYAEAKREDGLVVQTGRGEFKLNPRRRRAKVAA